MSSCYISAAAPLIVRFAGVSAQSYLVAIKVSVMFGYSASPMLMVGFVSSKDTQTKPTVQNHLYNESSLDNYNVTMTGDIDKWHCPYLITAAMIFLFNVAFFISKSSITMPPTSETISLLHHRPTTHTPLLPPGRWRALSIGLILCFCTVIQGGYNGFYNFIILYAYDVKFSEKEAVDLKLGSAVFALASSTLVIFIVNKIGILLVISLVLVTYLSSSLLFVFFTDTISVWILTGIITSSSAAAYSAPLALWHLIVGLPRGLPTALITSQCCGEILFNVILGQMIQENPRYLPYVVLSGAAVGQIVFTILLIIIFLKREKHDVKRVVEQSLGEGIIPIKGFISSRRFSHVWL